MGKIRGNWTEVSMKLAIDSVLAKEMTIRTASEKFGVPRSTLGDRVKILSNGGETIPKPCCSDNKGVFKKTFSDEQEAMLYKHVKALDSQLMPLSKTEFLKLAYNLAERLKIRHRFNKDKCMAGKDFYYDFMNRHQDLSLRTPEATSLQRAVGFSKDRVDRFFYKLTELMDKYKFNASRIFNADETGVSVVHNNNLKVMSVKGKKQVGKLTSAERGRNVTVLLAINAAGDQFIPPLFVFPRLRIDNDLKKDAPPGSIFDGQPSGWITKEGFLKWLKSFVDRVNPSETNPVLLIIDGHSSHKDLDVILYAKEKHIHMLSLPPHTSHKLQPLDRSIMKPFKNAYNEACGLWMRKYPNMKISLKDIAGLVNSAFSRICRMELAQSGFSCTGIHPLNRNVFTDIDFAAALGGQLCQNSETTTVATHMQTTETGHSTDVAVSAEPGPSSDMPASAERGPCLESSIETFSEDKEGTIDLESSATKQILEDISPLPSSSSIKYQIRNSRSEKSEILTSTPYKNQLVEKKALDEEKKVRAQEKKLKISERKREVAEEKNLKQLKKQIKKEKTEGLKATENSNKINQPVKRKSHHPPRTTAKRILNFDGNVASTSSKSTSCIICGECFEEDWIQCGICKGWAHENCATVDDSLFYYCDLCSQ